MPTNGRSSFRSESLLYVCPPDSTISEWAGSMCSHHCPSKRNEKRRFIMCLSHTGCGAGVQRQQRSAAAADAHLRGSGGGVCACHRQRYADAVGVSQQVPRLLSGACRCHHSHASVQIRQLRCREAHQADTHLAKQALLVPSLLKHGRGHHPVALQPPGSLAPSLRLCHRRTS